jgi:hypothetical protein
MNDKWYNSNFAEFLGIGILILLLCLGVGTCQRLAFSNETQNNKTLNHNVEHE